MAGRQAQLISDDLVQGLTEIASFFMPRGMVVSPVEYADDSQHVLKVQGNVLLIEVSSQQIVECGNRLSIRLNGLIREGFARPREFNFFLSHSYQKAKVFGRRDHLQTFELSEFLRLEYPNIPLTLSDSLFGLHFLDFSDSDSPTALLNGEGCLLLGESYN